MMNNSFNKWIIDTLRENGWSQSELSRRAELRTSTISMVLGGQSNPGLDFCLGIARAFREPPEYVLRRAGLLPSLPGGDRTAQEVAEVVRRLPQEEQDLVLEFAKWRLRGQ